VRASHKDFNVRYIQLGGGITISIRETDLGVAVERWEHEKQPWNLGTKRRLSHRSDVRHPFSHAFTLLTSHVGAKSPNWKLSVPALPVCPALHLPVCPSTPTRARYSTSHAFISSSETVPWKCMGRACGTRLVIGLIIKHSGCDAAGGHTVNNHRGVHAVCNLQI
jgi:hypothetical protein